MYDSTEMDTTYLPTLPTFESLKKNLVEEELSNSVLETSETRFSPFVEVTEEVGPKSTFETILDKAARTQVEPAMEDLPAATRRHSLDASWKPLGEPVDIPGAARKPRQISAEEIAASEELNKVSTVFSMLGPNPSPNPGIHLGPSNQISPANQPNPSPSSPLAGRPTHPSMVEQRSSIFEHLHHFRDGRGNFQFFQLGKPKEPTSVASQSIPRFSPTPVPFVRPASPSLPAAVTTQLPERVSTRRVEFTLEPVATTTPTPSFFTRTRTAPALGFL